MSAQFIAAIHNGELTTAPVAEVLEHLAVSSPLSTVTEVVDQQPLDDVPNLSELLRWGERQWQLEAQWRAYLENGLRLREAAARLGFMLWKIRLRSNSRFRSDAWQVRQIEAAVSAKHQEAWEHFSASNLPSALILESDASWTAGSEDRLKAVVGAIPSTAFYANLAGGLSHRHLAIRKIDSTSTGATSAGALVFEPAVTNTSCAYLINQPMAELLLNYCRTHPVDRTLGIDWLINATFMWARESEQQIVCWHSDPPILIHGSLAGITQSWHPGR